MKTYKLLLPVAGECDRDGQPIELHRIWAATQILEDTRLAPEETRSVIYHIPQPTSLPVTTPSRCACATVPCPNPSPNLPSIAPSPTCQCSRWLQ